MSDRFQQAPDSKNGFTVYDSYKRIYITDILEMIKEANHLHNERIRLKKIRAEQDDEIKLWSDAVHGLLAVQKLRQRGRIFDTWER